MMKIQVLLNLGTGQGLPEYKEDEIHDVDDALGNSLISKGFARVVDANQPAVKSGPGPAAKSELPPGGLDEDAFNKLRRKI